MAFSIFQTATATLNKITTDGFGDESVSASLSVEIDPTFGFKRMFNNNGEVVDGVSTIITGSGLQDFYDETHNKWSLTYNGKDWQVEQPVPFYKIGTDVLEHIEVALR